MFIRLTYSTHTCIRFLADRRHLATLLAMAALQVCVLSSEIMPYAKTGGLNIGSTEYSFSVQGAHVAGTYWP